MKRGFLLIAILFALQTNAQNYLINFTGSGAASTVSTVKVENLTAGTSLTISGGDFLRLTGLTGVSSIDDNQSSVLKIFPNPMTDKSTLQIFPPVTGDAIITIFDITGKLVAQIKSYLENQSQEFRLSGFKNGIYLVTVTGNKYQFSGKLLSNSKSRGIIKIEKINSIIKPVDEKAVKTDSKGALATVDMSYTIGDRIKFTGLSGIYSTIKIDIPVGNKTIDFNFIACTDGDNNNYPVVEIGSQVWMAENLKTTKYSNGVLIGTTTTPTEDNSGESTPKYQWAYEGNENNVSAYGRLYSWHALIDSRLLCPAGWHAPSDNEWHTLILYLDGSATLNITESTIAGGLLKETGYSHWLSPNTGTNERGFNALPGGTRGVYGDFKNLGIKGYWWSSTSYDAFHSMYRGLLNSDNYVDRDSYWMVDGFSVRCLKGATPSVSTTSVTTVASTSAVVGGNVTSEGSSSLIKRGVYWGTSANPESTGTELQIGNGTGSFSTSLSGLSPNTVYYVKAYATSSDGTSYGNETSFKTSLIIGDSYQGGKVAYVLQPADPGYVSGEIHGIIVALSDQSTGIQWYNGNYTLTGAAGTALGTGNTNTNAIVAAQGAGTYAARLCYDLVLNGYDDWYLPSRVELDKLLTGIGGSFLTIGTYWSSTEDNSNNAWARICAPDAYGSILCSQLSQLKSSTNSVRPIRSF
jgi:uncharacterized protein (TIGR02145 family)